MFELTATAKFSGSDAVNWLPVTPGEYVLASSARSPTRYSPALAFVPRTGRCALPRRGTRGARSCSSPSSGSSVCSRGRSSSRWSVRSPSGSGRPGVGADASRGRARGRALLLVLALQLAFNPVFLLDSLSGLNALGDLSAFLPVFWSTHALTLWLAGDAGRLALVFVAAQLVFAALPSSGSRPNFVSATGS